MRAYHQIRRFWVNCVIIFRRQLLSIHLLRKYERATLAGGDCISREWSTLSDGVAYLMVKSRLLGTGSNVNKQYLISNMKLGLSYFSKTHTPVFPSNATATTIINYTAHAGIYILCLCCISLILGSFRSPYPRRLFRASTGEQWAAVQRMRQGFFISAPHRSVGRMDGRTDSELNEINIQPDCYIVWWLWVLGAADADRIGAPEYRYKQTVTISSFVLRPTAALSQLQGISHPMYSFVLVVVVVPRNRVRVQC